MRLPRVSGIYIIAALTALGTSFGLHNLFAAQPGPQDAQEGVEVLTRGPVHEAFAETVTFNPEPGIVVLKAPPAAIEEVPPEQKPEGENVAWIPGYWGWDDERNDFLWVSGIWRALPPGRQWVPGYWGQSGRDTQWTSGYWADAAASEVEYLPEPPASVEVGPNIAAPSVDQTWIPGCWVWHQGRYAWRPGYWAKVQPNWVWVPAHYVWAPRGYVFVDGYWDYSVTRRGVLFAPVYFNASVYSRQGFYYSPATVINSGVFTSQLFLRPHYQHYYFGDYYAPKYSTAGFYPWFSYNSSYYGYDPIYAQQRWHHRADSSWERNVQADFQHRRNHEDARPPHTWAAQRAMTREASSNQKGFVVAEPLDQLTRSKDGLQRFQAVNQQQRQRLAKYEQDLQKYRQERQKLEYRAAGTSTAGPAKQADSARVKFPRSPIFAKSAGELGKDQGPPKRLEVLKPNLQIQPQPRSIESRKLGNVGPNGPNFDTKQRRSLGRREPSEGEPKANTTERKAAPPKTEPKQKKADGPGKPEETPKN